MQVLTIMPKTKEDNASSYPYKGVVFEALLPPNSCLITKDDSAFKIFINREYVTAVTGYKKAVGLATILLHDEDDQDS